MHCRLLFSLLSIVVLLPSATAWMNPIEQCSRTLNVRREWRDITDVQKTAYINAITCLGKLPHETTLKPTRDTPDIPAMNPNSSLYDDFVYAHIDLNVKIHFTALFLPWHRWFLHTFEATLRSKCNYTEPLPFWDWSRDANNGIPGSPVFNSSTVYGLGTFGTNTTNYTVTDGAFATTRRAYPAPHTIQRHFNDQPFETQVFPFAFTNKTMLATSAFTPTKVQSAVDGSPGNYTNFGYSIDGVRAQGMHNAAHMMMGGDMKNLQWSPNDPIFFLHHANIDCIWARWQAYRPENQFAYGGGLTQNLTYYDEHPVGSAPAANTSLLIPTDGLSKPIRVLDVLKTKNEYLCYECAY